MYSLTPPTSTEPMYLISESELSELEIDSSEDTYGSTDGIEIAERIRARGPVQQAPAGPCKDCTDPNQCYVPCHQVPKNPCIERGCTDIEDCDEICVHSRIFSPNWVKEHDAALIAQEREKWERERAQALPTETCPICDIAASCDHRFGANGYPPCVQRAAAQAREDVLAHLTAKLQERKSQIESVQHGNPIPERSRGRIIGLLDACCEIESLRSEVGK